MPFSEKISKARWWLLALIVILQIAVLVISPEEETLGIGIKPVYLHVSLTWTGMVLFLLTGLLALGVIISGNGRLACWQRRIFLISLLFYGMGFLISMYASWLNWGGIPWQEPKIRTALNVVVSGIGAWYLCELVRPLRLKGAAGLIPLVYLFFGGRSPRMVLHPDNPVASSPIGIQSTFYILFGLAILFSIWSVWTHHSRTGGC